MAPTEAIKLDETTVDTPAAVDPLLLLNSEYSPSSSPGPSHLKNPAQTSSTTFPSSQKQSPSSNLASPPAHSVPSPRSGRGWATRERNSQRSFGTRPSTQLVSLQAEESVGSVVAVEKSMSVWDGRRGSEGNATTDVRWSWIVSPLQQRPVPVTEFHRLVLQAVP